MSDDFPKLYNVNDTAERIGIKARVLRHWVTTGEIKPIKIAGRLYFTAKLVRAVVAEKMKDKREEIRHRRK